MSAGARERAQGRVGWWLFASALALCVILLAAADLSLAASSSDARESRRGTLVDSLYLLALRHGVLPAPLMVTPPLADPDSKETLQ